MIIHIALFRWKENTTTQEINDALLSVKALENKCPGVKSIHCGKNFHKEAKGFTHGIVVLAENQNALDGYRQHPDHKFIAQKIEAIEEDGIGFDFQDLK